MTLEEIAEKIRIFANGCGDQNGYRTAKVSDVIRYLKTHAARTVADSWQTEPVEWYILHKEDDYLKTRCCDMCRNIWCKAGAGSTKSCVVNEARSILGNPEM